MKILNGMFIGIVIGIIIIGVCTVKPGPLFTEKETVSIGSVEISHTKPTHLSDEIQKIVDTVKEELNQD